MSFFPLSIGIYKFLIKIESWVAILNFNIELIILAQRTKTYNMYSILGTIIPLSTTKYNYVINR